MRHPHKRYLSCSFLKVWLIIKRRVLFFAVWRGDPHISQWLVEENCPSWSRVIWPNRCQAERSAFMKYLIFGTLNLLGNFIGTINDFSVSFFLFFKYRYSYNPYTRNLTLCTHKSTFYILTSNIKTQLKQNIFS